jgi:lysophospholipase L1-like esterase
VVVMLGTNDMALAVDPEQYRTNIEAAVTAIRADDPDVPLVLVGAWQHRIDGVHPWSDYLEQLEELAASLPATSYLDMTEHWPRAGSPEADALGYYGDGIHLASVGNVAFAQLLADGLLDQSSHWRLIGHTGDDS